MDKEQRRPSAGGERGTTMSYRGHRITYHDPGPPDKPVLSIDGEDVMVVREDTGGYAAPMLNMFATYRTLEDLARQLIDISPVFLAKRRQRSEPEHGSRKSKG